MITGELRVAVLVGLAEYEDESVEYRDSDRELTSDADGRALIDGDALKLGEPDALGVAPPKPAKHESVTLPSAPTAPGAPPAAPEVHVTAAVAIRFTEGTTYDEPPPPGVP